jgi:hypothetical protein
MPTIDYLPVATGVGANVDTQSNFAGSAYQTKGFQSGQALSIQMNKVLRQASMFAAVLANYISLMLGINVFDDGNFATLYSNYVAAVRAQVLSLFTDSGFKAALHTYVMGLFSDSPWLTSFNAQLAARLLLGPTISNPGISNATLTGNPTAPTPATGDVSALLATTLFVKNVMGNGASFTASSTGSLTLPPFTVGGVNVILQWSTLNAAPGLNGFSFNFTFPNNVLAVFCCYDAAGPAVNACGIQPLTAVTATIRNNDSGSHLVRWFALGY